MMKAPRFLFLTILTLTLSSLRASAADWSVSYLDYLLSHVEPDQTTMRVGDMDILVKNVRAWRNQLAGTPSPRAAFDGFAPLWPGGKVYYAFDGSVSAAKQKAFLDAAGEWALMANVQFTQRVAQANYMLVAENGSLSGGQSAVGMVGGAQLFQIGPSAWNRSTLCHEIGHTLGMVHEHQRSDRDSFIQVFTNNVAPGQLGNFTKLGNSQNLGAYDFFSIMHYSTNLFSANPAILNTMYPLVTYNQYAAIMGAKYDPVLSPLDRASVVTKYGVGPVLTSVVTNTTDSGFGSLRAALYYASDHPGTTITFNIPVTDPGLSNGVFNILITDGLPSLVNSTVLDGTTQTTNSNPNGPEILLNGSLCVPLSVYPSGLKFTGTNCTARGFIVTSFPSYGVLFQGTNATSNTVSSCYLGINPSGTAPATNGICPVDITGGASWNIVGGNLATDRNVISGSRFQGLTIHGAGTHHNIVQGNYIGLNATGTGSLSNTWSGIQIYGGAQSNRIGGATLASFNIISGNGRQGVSLSETNTSYNVVDGNLIGLNPTGTAALSNGWAGVNIFGGASTNFIGLPSASARNVISGNGNQGVLIGDPGTFGNVVSANYIGLGIGGTNALGNSYAGIAIFNSSKGNIVGGSSPGAGNVISGNTNQGVSLSNTNTSGNVISGNYIGLNAYGTSAVANAWSGIEFYFGASGNLVGGGPGARNFIAGNGNYGISMNSSASANIVRGNTFGFDAFNSGIVPNVFANIAIFAGGYGNKIGDTNAGWANLMRGSPSDSIQIADASTTNNSVRGNSIFANGGVAIALYNNANRSVTNPVLTSVTVSNGTTVVGSLVSTPNTTFQIDFYSDVTPAASAESMTYLGSRSVTTSAGGAVTFTNTLGAVLPTGRAVTATATDPLGNTSRLSPGSAVTLTSGVTDNIPNAWRALYFGGTGATTNSQSCATCDPDGDGMNNRAEFLAGTNPTNAASQLSLVALPANGSGNIASFLSSTGIVYRLEYRNDAATGLWSILADQIIGDGSALILSDPYQNSFPQRFYRAEVLW